MTEELVPAEVRAFILECIEAVSRFVLAFHPPGDEREPLHYLPRLFAFRLIAISAVLKNCPHKR